MNILRTKAVVPRPEVRILDPGGPILGPLQGMTEVGRGIRYITDTMTMDLPTHTDVLRHAGGTLLLIQEVIDVQAVNIGAAFLLEK